MKKKSLGLAAALVLALAHMPLLAQAPKKVEKKDPRFTGYGGKKWEKDFGVFKGRCDNAAMAAEAGKKDRAAAAFRGDSRLGTLDGADRGCIGHALELTLEKKTVVWTSKQSGVAYRLTPTRTFKQGNVPCREFTTLVTRDKKEQSVRATACRSGDGEWTAK